MNGATASSGLHERHGLSGGVVVGMRSKRSLKGQLGDEETSNTHGGSLRISNTQLDAAIGGCQGMANQENQRYVALTNQSS